MAKVELRGEKVKAVHGLERSLEQFENESPEFRREVADFIRSLVSHYVFDDGKVVAAHAGMKETFQGWASGHPHQRR